jgi:hypothetical protein
MPPQISASETAPSPIDETLTLPETINEALTALSIRPDDIAGFGAVFLTDLAVILLRVLAVAALASPLLVVWLVW